ncbi:MAG: NrpR regulatory domain-containing protein [Lentisphaerota bacterium]|jgi:repressor of nif and glnA expression
MMEKVERTQSAILKVLSDVHEPVGASRIVELLLGAGLDVSARTVRFHLLELDRRGLTALASRRSGRVITQAGRDELAKSNVLLKVGLVSAKVDTMTYTMSFDVGTGEGTVITNTALLHRDCLPEALAEMRQVFRAQLGVGNRAIIVPAGEQVGGAVVPEGFAGIGTVCSITFSGIFLRRCIPLVSRFGGLLEIRDRKPVRFVDLIEYRGTTLDPLEVFIQAGMTRVRDAARTGNGLICAGFREIPAVAIPDVEQLRIELRRKGLNGLLAMGRPNQPLFGIPVSDGHAGLVVLGGLNPVAAIREAGYSVRLRSLAGIEEYTRFRPLE